jgi:hypothetical protein
MRTKAILFVLALDVCSSRANLSPPKAARSERAYFRRGSPSDGGGAGGADGPPGRRLQSGRRGARQPKPTGMRAGERRGYCQERAPGICKEDRTAVTAKARNSNAKALVLHLSVFWEEQYE